ncbi:EpsG family protein [Acinetobacter pseudolwoffii]|uniref:EpsG family protein n=1 Tax=Acinetobacter pseudolwoffii TaxID=2053287 RepID=UPI00398964D9
MYLFILLAVVLLLGALIRPRNQSIYLLCSYLILLFLSAFRDISVGTDTESYENIFYQIVSNNDYLLSIEPGWIFLNKAVDYMGFDFRGILVISSFLTLSLIFLTVKKYSFNPMFSIALFYLLYFYFISFNISRQLLAVSIVLISTVLILNNKKISSFCLILLASFFHQSALIALILYFYIFISNKKPFIITGIIVSMIFGIFGANIITQVVGYTEYSYYIENYENNSVLGKTFLLILFNMFFIYLTLCLKEYSNEFKIFYIFILILNMTILIPFGSRFVLYFSIYQILFFPYFINKISGTRNFKIFSIFIVTLYSFIIFFTSLGKGGVLPYNNILF